MPLKRPVTLAQARRWPAAAKRRESFCARMGGMRELLTGERAARDPGSPINRALAAWDCDKPEGLKREHVSKGIRPMKITKAKVGSESSNPAKAPARIWNVFPKVGKRYLVGSFSTKARAEDYVRTLNAPWNYKIVPGTKRDDNPAKPKRRPGVVRMVNEEINRMTATNPARETMLYVVHVADSQGNPAYDIAKFRKRADALQYARAYADANKVRVVLTSRAL
jgi:hypothetical protein